MTCHFVYLRLTTRGLERSLRAGLSLARTLAMKVRHDACATRGRSGGKIARVGDGLAGDA